MVLAVWTEDLVTGHPLIDQQHQHLFELINSLDESLQKPISREDLGLLLADLLDYTQIHFRSEEELMRYLQYPQYHEHRVIHEQLTKQVMDLLFRLHHGESSLSLFFDVSGFLADWLKHHIRENDLHMVRFVRQALKKQKALSDGSRSG